MMWGGNVAHKTPMLMANKTPHFSFLFIIMLLDLRAEVRRKFNKLALVGGGLVSLAFAAQVFGVLERFPMGKKPFPELI